MGCAFVWPPEVTWPPEPLKVVQEWGVLSHGFRDCMEEHSSKPLQEQTACVT